MVGQLWDFRKEVSATKDAKLFRQTTQAIGETSYHSPQRVELSQVHH